MRGTSRFRRPILAGVVAALTVTTSLSGNLGQAASVTTEAVSVTKVTKEQLARFKKETAARATRYASGGPVGLNPATSLVPPDQPRDYQGWTEAAREGAAAREALRDRTVRGRVVAPPLTARESEPRGTRGSNDTRANADELPGFGTRRNNPRATLLGALSPEVVPVSSLVSIKPNKEDDGSPDGARETGVSSDRDGIKTTGFRGDAPGATPADRAFDLDFYRLNVADGTRITARMVATSGNLEPIMFVVDEDLNFVNDSSFEEIDQDVEFSTSLPAGGVYYLVTSGWYVITGDPATDGDTTGKYSLTLSAGQDDRDVWAVDLRAGDVLGATLDSPGYVSVSGPRGTETHRSPFDASFIYPLDSPLPGASGYPVTDYVAAKDGRYFVTYGGGEGTYTGTLEVYRPGGEGARKQTIFLDTDGARVNTRIWDEGSRLVNLSPLSSFLGKWG
ncbi:MAG: hypothetical protein ACRCYU_20200, partial [Nocardioides sp.]